MTDIDIFVDGSCLSNQTPEDRRAGAGYVVVEDDERVAERSEYIGMGEDVSCNVAEYEAITAALEWRASNRPDDSVTVHSDSELCVYQTQNRWNCNEPHLFRRMTRAQNMLGHNDAIVVADPSPHVSRAHDLAQAGARQSEAPTDSGTSTSGSGSAVRSQSSDAMNIEPDVLDEVPGPVEQPHDGIVPENIPDELKKHVSWVNWKPQYIDGRETKVPVQPGTPHRKAKSNDNSTWGDFATAIDTVDEDVPGIGFVLSKKDEYVALDFDSCRSMEDYVIDEWVMDVVHDLDSYSHVSVSNTGLHTFVRADGVPEQWTNRDDGYDKKLEVYDSVRFMAFTGHTLDSVSNDVTRVDDFDEWLLELETEVWDD